MKCCGHKIETMFCPHCGKMNEADPLPSLLAYLRYNQSNREKQSKAADDEKSKNRSYKSVVKWKKWADALERLMQRDRTMPPEAH